MVVDPMETFWLLRLLPVKADEALPTRGATLPIAFDNLMSYWAHAILYKVDDIVAQRRLEVTGRRYPLLTEGGAKAIIEAIEEQLVYELFVDWAHWRKLGYKHPPGFDRLSRKARLVFVEDLIEAIDIVDGVR